MDNLTCIVNEIGFLENILCKIIEQDGGTYVVETPHGTKIQLGWFHLVRNWAPIVDGQARWDAFIEKNPNRKSSLQPVLENADREHILAPIAEREIVPFNEATSKTSQVVFKENE